MDASASRQELVVETMLSFRDVLVAKHRLVNQFALREKGERRIIHTDVVECSDAVEVSSGGFD